MPSPPFLESASAHRDRMAARGGEPRRRESTGTRRRESPSRIRPSTNQLGCVRAVLPSARSAVSCHTMSIIREAAGRSRAGTQRQVDLPAAVSCMRSPSRSIASSVERDSGLRATAFRAWVADPSRCRGPCTVRPCPPTRTSPRIADSQLCVAMRPRGDVTRRWNHPVRQRRGFQVRQSLQRTRRPGSPRPTTR
jgi:hypothetical protein